VLKLMLTKGAWVTFWGSTFKNFGSMSLFVEMDAIAKRAMVFPSSEVGLLESYKKFVKGDVFDKMYKICDYTDLRELFINKSQKIINFEDIFPQIGTDKWLGVDICDPDKKLTEMIKDEQNIYCCGTTNKKGITSENIDEMIEEVEKEIF